MLSHIPLPYLLNYLIPQLVLSVSFHVHHPTCFPTTLTPTSEQGSVGSSAPLIMELSQTGTYRDTQKPLLVKNGPCGWSSLPSPCLGVNTAGACCNTSSTRPHKYRKHCSYKNKCCSTSNATYLTMLACEDRGGCWQYGSACWTPTSIPVHVVVVQHMVTEGQSDRMESDKEERKMQRCEAELLHVERIALLIFTDTYQTFMETKRWTWTQWSRGFCLSAVETPVGKTSHIPEGRAHLSHHERKTVWISSCIWISGLWTGTCLQSWTLYFMHWKEKCHHCNRAKFASGGNYEGSPRNRKNSVRKFVRNNWTHTQLKVTVSWVTSLTVMRHGVTTTRQSKEPESMEWQYDISLSKKKFETQPSPVKLMCTGFWDRKGEILPELIEPR